MAVAIDAVATAPTIVSNATSPGTLTTLTVGAGATALLVIVNSAIDIGSPTPTWDSGGTNQSVSQVGTANISGGFIWIFGLLSPTSGNKTLSVSWTGGTISCIIEALSFTGTATNTIANAFQNFGSATPPASTSNPITLTGASGNISVCSAANDSNIYVSPFLDTTGSTSLYNDGTHVAGTASYAPSAASVTWTAHPATSLASVLAGVDVAAASSPSVIPRPMRSRTYLTR